ncbi:vWA domain-containing protein [Risungbinella massiliensis]|uniref:vWA domain-containing protein n=1 Tax=Risungbinella massiliensis TaxID=1329796 RepID=UPI0005CBE9C9|nr:VWA domain-containing protein [Risungbinella massiliensis]
MHKVRAPLFTVLLGSAVFLGGCSAVTKHIESNTGNQIEKVELQAIPDEKTPSQSNKESETKSKNEPKAPTNSRLLEDILLDDGSGKYAGDQYNLTKVHDSLKQMPKGDNEQVYNYILGLVGEGYKKKMERYRSIYQPNYSLHLDHYRKAGSQDPPAHIQTVVAPTPKPTHVTIILDASGSMAAKMEGKRKIDLVKEKLTSFIQTLPKGTMVTLKVYGHKGSSKQEEKQISCQGDEIVYQNATFTPDQLASALAQVDAKGYAPLSKALNSPDNFIPAPNTDQKILLFTDGMDNCGGNVKQSVEQLKEIKQAKIDIMAVQPSDSEKQSLQTLAQETGGDFDVIRNEQDLQAALDHQKNSVSLTQRRWQDRALEEITHEYSSADQELSDEHELLEQVVETENDRLTEANRYIYQRKLIAQNDYKTIQQWIQEREEGLEEHLESQHIELEKKLATEYETFSKKVVEETPPSPSKEGLEKRRIELENTLKFEKDQESFPRMIEDDISQ